MKKDSVDLIVEQWKEAMPELQTEAMAILGRLTRVVKYSERALNENFSNFNLNSGEFDVLATLRRSGGAFKLKPTALYHQLMVTSGAMTNRIDTLESKGLVKRVHDEEDRRAVYVTLTQEGYEVINQAVEAHVLVEAQLLEKLKPEEKILLDGLLRKLLE